MNMSQALHTQYINLREHVWSTCVVLEPGIVPSVLDITCILSVSETLRESMAVLFAWLSNEKSSCLNGFSFYETFTHIDLIATTYL
jgi:hypothetical protein